MWTLGRVVGKIENTPGVHGIAVAPELGRGFVSNGQPATVTIFDLETLQKIADVPTGKKPDAILYDPATTRVFAFNGGSNSATVIDAQEGKVAGTIDLGGGPEFAASDGKGYVFDNLEDEGLVLKIDANKMAVEHRWKACDAPSSMAMDRENRRLGDEADLQFQRRGHGDGNPAGESGQVLSGGDGEDSAAG